MNILEVTDVKINRHYSTEGRLYIDFKVNSLSYYILLIKTSIGWEIISGAVHDEEDKYAARSFLSYQ